MASTFEENEIQQKNLSWGYPHPRLRNHAISPKHENTEKCKNLGNGHTYGGLDYKSTLIS